MTLVYVRRCPRCSGIQETSRVHRLWCPKDLEPVTLEEEWQPPAVDVVEVALSTCACDVHPDLCPLHGPIRVRAEVALSVAYSWLDRCNYGPNPIPNPDTTKEN